MNRYISVPDTDLELCSIGLGTLGAGIKWDGAEADRIFDAYLDLGGNVVDTARIYQDWIPGETGRSERAVGDWISRSGRRNEIILMTKGGHPKYRGPEDDLHIPRMTDADMRNDIELSLRALRTDVIDIYFYHRDDLSQSIEEEIETMERFVREGKIRYYACSNWTAERMKEADRYCRQHGHRSFVADQAFLNIGMKYMNPLEDDTLTFLKDDIAAYHRENRRNLAMAYYTSASGFFHSYLKSGVIRDETYNTPGDLAIAKKIAELAEKYNTGITQVVLGYVLSQDYPCLALYGPSSPERIREAMSTLDVSFDKNDYKEMMA